MRSNRMLSVWSDRNRGVKWVKRNFTHSRYRMKFIRMCFLLILACFFSFDFFRSVVFRRHSKRCVGFFRILIFFSQFCFFFFSLAFCFVDSFWFTVLLRRPTPSNWLAIVKPKTPLNFTIKPTEDFELFIISNLILFYLRSKECWRFVNVIALNICFPLNHLNALKASNNFNWNNFKCTSIHHFSFLLHLFMLRNLLNKLTAVVK